MRLVCFFYISFFIAHSRYIIYIILRNTDVFMTGAFFYSYKLLKRKHWQNVTGKIPAVYNTGKMSFPAVYCWKRHFASVFVSVYDIMMYFTIIIQHVGIRIENNSNFSIYEPHMYACSTRQTQVSCSSRNAPRVM